MEVSIEDVERLIGQQRLEILSLTKQLAAANAALRALAPTPPQAPAAR